MSQDSQNSQGNFGVWALTYGVVYFSVLCVRLIIQGKIK